MAKDGPHKMRQTRVIGDVPCGSPKKKARPKPQNEKRFLSWPGIMVPLVSALTVIGWDRWGQYPNQ
jgi:hypothetical protein